MSARITVGQKSTDMIKNMRKYITIPHSSRSRLPLSIGMGTAQGGIATVWSGEDSFESHIEDTHRAGVGLCRPDIVDLVVRDAPSKIRELIEWGDRCTRRDGGQEDDLGLDGGRPQ